MGTPKRMPLSPHLLLIVMEGLSRPIASAKRDGRLKGLKMSDLCYLTHLLFVDLDGSIWDSTTFHEILALFAQANGMIANQRNSTISLSHTSH